MVLHTDGVLSKGHIFKGVVILLVFFYLLLSYFMLCNHSHDTDLLVLVMLSKRQVKSLRSVTEKSSLVGS